MSRRTSKRVQGQGRTVPGDLLQLGFDITQKLPEPELFQLEQVKSRCIFAIRFLASESKA